jgi:hypothetical protein
MSRKDSALCFLVVASLTVLWSCLDQVQTPELAGPSELGSSLQLSAIPDELVADGWSSSVIEAVFRDQDGQRQSGVTIHFDLGARNESSSSVVFFDIGNLAPLNGPRPLAGGTEAKPVSAVTDGDGVARARYWAPFRTDQANDIEVSVTARPAGTDFNSAVSGLVSIKLRAADRPSFPGGPSCSIMVEPVKSVYEVDEIVFFTATQATGSCGNNPIARYEWDFGDGNTAVGRNVSHVFSDGCGATGCEVTLWTTEAVTGCVASCSVTIGTPGSSVPGPGPGPGPGPPGQTLHSFTSMDVPKGANSGAGCPNGIPCIISTVDTSGVTGTIVFMRVAFHGTFPDTSSTSVHLYGPGYPGVDERAAFDADGVGAGFGASCGINPRGSFTGPGATTWDDDAPGTLGVGTTPYDASYRGGLSPGLTYIGTQLNANPGDINGTYTLVIDRWTVGGITTETLDCWTLEIWTVP